MKKVFLLIILGLIVSTACFAFNFMPEPISKYQVERFNQIIESDLNKYNATVLQVLSKNEILIQYFSRGRVYYINSGKSQLNVVDDEIIALSDGYKLNGRFSFLTISGATSTIKKITK